MFRSQPIRIDTRSDLVDGDRNRAYAAFNLYNWLLRVCISGGRPADIGGVVLGPALTMIDRIDSWEHFTETVWHSAGKCCECLCGREFILFCTQTAVLFTKTLLYDLCECYERAGGHASIFASCLVWAQFEYNREWWERIESYDECNVDGFWGGGGERGGSGQLPETNTSIKISKWVLFQTQNTLHSTKPDSCLRTRHSMRSGASQMRFENRISAENW